MDRSDAQASRAPGDGAWPAHEIERLPWRQQQRGGTREDRTATFVDATIPPRIAWLDVPLEPGLRAQSDAALMQVTRADSAAEGSSAALSRFLIRSESVASSKIEGISAGAEDYARAVAGSRANASATSMVAAAEALRRLIERVGEHGFTVEIILDSHRALMESDPSESEHAGLLRDMQSWVGGSDFSPRNALHVPPAPARVPGLMDDLVDYLNRDDLPVLTQAAIAHAQFESIHPFTDGNGRIGRAIVGAVFRRRGVTQHTVVPLGSGILARRDDYFEALERYRKGDAQTIVALFALSARVGAVESRATIERVRALPAEWTSRVGARTGSTSARLIRAFFEHPVLRADEVARLSGSGTSQTADALTALERSEVIREITGRSRARAWVAPDLTAELDDLDSRIQAAMRSNRSDR